MTDGIEIVYKGGVFGAYEYEATYKGMTETLMTSAAPDEKALLMAMFMDIFKRLENVRP